MSLDPLDRATFGVGGGLGEAGGDVVEGSHESAQCLWLLPCDRLAQAFADQPVGVLKMPAVLFVVPPAFAPRRQGIEIVQSGTFFR